MLPASCKICGEASGSFATVAAGKHCNLQLPQAAPDSGRSVHYHRCPACDFIFSNFLDEYSRGDLCAEIYNDDYINYDPLYPAIRPRTNARFLQAVLKESFPAGEPPRVLDYGAGSGALSTLMAEGFAVQNYDALNPAFDVLPPGPADVIFSCEVVEHMPFPGVFADDWGSRLSESGCVIFSTKLQPADIDVIREAWWYLGPRNGHVSLFSDKSLRLLLSRAGLSFESLTEDWHIAYKHPRHRVSVETLQRNMDLLPSGFVMV